VERRRAKTLLPVDRRFDRWVYYPMTFVNDIFAFTAKAAAVAKITLSRLLSRGLSILVQPSRGE
jgi:hypothetical protein